MRISGRRVRSVDRWTTLLNGPARRVGDAVAGEGLYELGVARESRDALSEIGALPHRRAPYLERDVDGELRALLRRGAEGGDPLLVVVAGPARAGKSRTLAEALAAVLPDAWLLAPRDGGALVALALEEEPGGRLGSWVIWLDDLESFVRDGEEGLNVHTLRLILAGGQRPTLIVATVGGRGVGLAGDAVRRLAERQAELLDHPAVGRVHLEASLSENEQQALRSQLELPDATVEKLAGAGIGAHMLGRGVARLLLDVPSERPVLGFEPIARALGNTIVQSDPRFAIGIFGGWGSGKTTLMQAIERRLSADEAVCVRFVAWRYEKEEHLIVPLLDVIREELLRWSELHGNDRTARDTAATIGRVLRSLLAGMSVSVGLPGAVEASFDANSALQEHSRLSDAEAQAHVPRSFYHASFRALESAFSRFIGANRDRRIVVFVDDLDRCLPENALQVLESMKLFFDLDGFVFVVGLDDSIIERAVEWKYAARSRSGAPERADAPEQPREEWRVSGREYVQKVFQLPYRLKPVSVQDLGTFIQAASKEAGFSDEQRQDLRGTVEGHLAYLVGDGTVNPREIKRYINLYTLQLLIDPELNRNAVLALQTISFRRDWKDTIHGKLLQFREEYLNAVRMRVTASADGRTGSHLYEEHGPFPEDFLEYLAAWAPGRDLLTVEDLEPYLSVGDAVRATSSPALREALATLGEVRSLLHGATRDSVNVITAGELTSRLSLAEGQVAAAAGGSAQGRGVATSLRRLRGRVERELEPSAPEGLSASAEYEAVIAELIREADAVSQSLLRLYRRGDTVAAEGLPEPGVGFFERPEPDVGLAERPEPDFAYGAPPEPDLGPFARPEPDVASTERQPEPTAVAPQEVGSPREENAIEERESPVRPLSVRMLRDLAPYELGVRWPLAGATLYVPRDADEELRKLVETAIRTGEPRLILVTGPALSGKTRTAYEALVAEPTLSESAVLAPRPAGVFSLRLPQEVDTRLPSPPIVWLDDLGRLGGLDARGLRDDLLPTLTMPGRRVVALGTVTDRDLSAGAEQRLGSLAADGLVGIVRLEGRLSAQEVERLRAAHPSLSPADAEDPIGAQMMGRAGLIERLEASRQESPAGRAIVAAAVDWVRAGMREAIPESRLRDLWTLLLPEGGERDESFERGLAWALEDSPDAVAPLVQVSHGAYEPNPIAVEYEQKLGREVSTPVWDAILAGADPETALLVGRAAARLGSPQRAAWALTIAERSESPETAGAAATAVGRLLEDVEDFDGAQAAFARADSLGDGKGAARLGMLLAQREDYAGAEAALRRADERGYPGAVLALGRLRERRGDLDGAIAAYARADELGELGGTLELARLLNERGDARGAELAFLRAGQAGSAMANFNVGLLLQQRGDFEDAERFLRSAVDGGDAMAAATLALLLERRGESDEALDLQRFAAERGDQMAAYNLGRMLHERGEREQAVRWLRESEDSRAPELLAKIASSKPPEPS